MERTGCRWAVLPFRLVSAPYMFTKFLTTSRNIYLRHLRYLDDILILGGKEELEIATRKLVSLFEGMHFILSGKSVLTPTKKLDFIGFNITERSLKIRGKTLEKLVNKVIYIFMNINLVGI